MRPLQIAIDLLGGDTTADQFLSFLHDHRLSISRPLHLFVFTQNASQKSSNIPNVEISFIQAKEHILMDEDPIKAIRQKKHSSMALGIEMVKKKQVDGFLSTGNSGALISLAKISLPLFSGISRPALLALIPTQKDPLAVIDVGANVSCKPSQMIEFAKLGVSFQQTLGIKQPKLALLNIGAEKQKGKRESKQSYQHLKDFPEFIGNIEGTEVFKGNVHVLVTDGFTGNVFLKTAEGVSAFLLDQLQKFSLEKLRDLKEEIHQASGAFITGIHGFMMKCHGNASPASLSFSLQKMITFIEKNFLSSFASIFLEKEGSIR